MISYLGWIFICYLMQVKIYNRLFFEFLHFSVDDKYMGWYTPLKLSSIFGILGQLLADISSTEVRF